MVSKLKYIAVKRLMSMLSNDFAGFVRLIIAFGA